MSAIDFDNEKSPFTPSGDLEDESNLNEILMDSHDADIEDDVVVGEQEFASEALLEDESAKKDDDEDDDGED